MARSFAPSPGVRMALQSSFPYLLPIQTRWKDNDQYGHVNNVVYYEFFDTVINHFLTRRAGLRPTGDSSAPIGLCIESSCKFKAPLSYPEVVCAGNNHAR